MKRFSIIILLTLIIIPFKTMAVTLDQKLAGKILLQVEKNGEAWYVHPGNNKRYFLGRPENAFSIMREQGLGIKHNELADLLNSVFPVRLAGRIMLDVEQNGEAYYVNPSDLKGRYLGRPADAFSVMRQLGLGISNADLKKISISSESVSLESVDDNWNLYKNGYFGFSIELPKEHDECGRISTMEYEDRVDLVCENRPNRLWSLYIYRFDGEDGLEKAIQDRYGSACAVDKKIPTDQESVYKVDIKIVDREQCPLTGGIQTYYNAVDHVAVTWGTGQDVTFLLDGRPADNLITTSLDFMGEKVQKQPYCTAEPTHNDYGTRDYPIALAYSDISFLGQFFTAFECGRERLKQVYGNDSVYRLGSTVWLKDVPDQPTIHYLNSADFHCDDGKKESECTKWMLTGEIDMKLLYDFTARLSDKFKTDDCVNCG